MSKSLNIAFTICSNNYLGQALALKRSFLKHNPDFLLYIILVDEFSEVVDYSQFHPATVIKISDVKGFDLEDLLSKYYIIELNTSIKPSVFKHLIKENPETENIYYLDPDLYFYDSLNDLNELLKTKTAVLTPHIVTPIPRDSKMPDENIFLNYGIYNLGFLGLNANRKETEKLLDWWEERTINYGFDRAQNGYFVDQLWMVQSPLFFEGIEIIKTFNYNMAPWNLHERHITGINNDEVILNDNSRLVFYHFSKITDDRDAVSREYDRFILDDFPFLRNFYAEYKNVLETCNYRVYRNIPIALPVKMSLAQNEPKKKAITVDKTSVLHKTLRKIGNFFNRLANKV